MTFLCDPGWCVNKSDVQNRWDGNTHSEWHRMTRMTGPDCVVMCNLINTHTHTHTHTEIMLYGKLEDTKTCVICTTFTYTFAPNTTYYLLLPTIIILYNSTHKPVT